MHPELYQHRLVPSILSHKISHALSHAQVVEVEARGPLEFEYDPEWLAIMRTTNDTVNLRHQHRCV